MAKIGSIKITKSLIDENFINQLKPLFEVFYPVFIDHNSIYGIVVYTGYCELFEDIKDGLIVPAYSVCIEKGKVEISKV